ncbi:MAG: EAL domain-containing protein [Lachnospiraceae bacterium]|nr:EAL domain-containing protein [Lachnospiraceae bacterium]
MGTDQTPEDEYGGRKMMGEKGRQKMAGWKKCILAAGVILAVLRPATVKAADEIYAAGAPDAWPLEYYEKGEYQGILPELLEEAAQAAGIKVSYVRPSKEDNRLALAENVQVDVIWSYGLTEEEMEQAGLVLGSPVLTFTEDGEKKEICPAYSKSMPRVSQELIEEQLGRLDRAQIEGRYLVYAKKGHEKGSLSYLYRYVIPGCLAAAVVVLLIMPFILAKRKRQIETLACLDDVTKKGNFAVWKKRYLECIQDGNREHFAVLYLYTGADIVSQIYGYDEGEAALRLISNICMDSIDQSAEAAARFNEFSFVFFVQYTSVDALKQRVQDMEDSLEEEFHRAGKRYFLELHVGIYRLTGADSDPLKTLQYSEIAMRYARKHYLPYVLYDEAVEQETISGYAMGHEAVHGLMHQEFIMYLQPIVDLKTGAICGAEALARWENPNRGLLGPEKFLRVMKKKQLVGKMNMEIYRQGCRFLLEAKNRGLNLHLIFNFTVENVGDETFTEQLYAVTQQYGIDPHQIIIQLNQMVEITRSEIYMKTIRKLREYGFDVCLAGLELDRVFLDYLECGANGLKLRQDLVRQIETERGYKVIENLIRLCHDLGLKVVPVGVENERQAELLKGLGCEMASGFYYYYPVSQKSFAEMIDE